MKKRRIYLMLSLLCIFILLFSCSENSSVEKNDEELVTIIDGNGTTDVAIVLSVEINPSIKLSLNSDEKVISYKALNDDAQLLNLESIVGLDAVIAVEFIVTEAKNKGFITEDDLEEDYILITSVPIEVNIKEVDNLGQRIKAHIVNSEDMKSVNVAMIKATKIELREAEGKKVPVGLYVINGFIDAGDESVSVKEFFSNNKNAEKFKKKGVIVEKNQEKRFEQVQRYLDRLESQGYEINDFRDRSNQGDFDVKSLSEEIRDYVKKNRTLNDNPSNENKKNSKGKGN